MIDIDSSWTLFLDRDGVINDQNRYGYIQYWEEFRFLPGALIAMEQFKSLFGKIVVVTNQQGLGKGLMSEDDLTMLHENMKIEVHRAQGKIDAIYYCPHLKGSNCDCRKPKIGMALQAQGDFPSIEFNKSVLVGDNPSDMAMGNNFGATTVFVGPIDRLENNNHAKANDTPDYICNSLIDVLDLFRVTLVL